MKVLIQSCDTMTYLTEGGDWSHRHEDALEFPNSVRALEYCLNHKLSNVRIVLKFPEPLHDVVLPVTASGCGQGA